MRTLCCLLLLIFITSGCAAKDFNEFKLGNQGYSDEQVGIWLIPVFGADPLIVADLEKRLQKQHGVRVKTTTEMGLDAHHFDKAHQQFIADEIAGSAVLILNKLRVTYSKASAIIIIPGDMNDADFRLRYIFSKHFFKERLTVISLARIDPKNYGLPMNRDLVLDRANKLINKALGYHLYGYKPSSDIASVMYGPIMSLDDLDAVNIWYK